MQLFFLLRMRENFVLLSLDGPHSNVMKIKPPLKFDKQNATELIEKLDQVLGQLNSKL